MKIWKRVSLRCLVLISSRAMDWYEQKSAVTCWISSLARPSNWGGGGSTGGAQSPPGLALPSLTPSRALPELVHPSALAPQSPLYPPIHPSSRRRRRPQQPSLPTRDSMRSPISLMIGPSSRSFFMDSERESGRGCEKTRSELGLLEGNLPRAAAPTPALQARRAKVGDARASRRWALADPRI